MDLVELVAPPEVLDALRNGKRSGAYIVALCPRCAPQHRKRKPTLSAGTPHGHAWWGCHRCKYHEDVKAGIKLERAKFDLRSLSDADYDKRRTEWAVQIFEKSSEIRSGDFVDRYLRQTRKLDPGSSWWPMDLRRAMLKYRDEKKPRPGMVAAIRNITGQIVAVHRTYLFESADGVFKADDDQVPENLRVDGAKMVLGPMRGAAIRLGVDSETLGICEGIETAVAFENFIKYPCWSTVTAGGMEVVQIPDHVTRVIIGPDIGDKNSRGMQAAITLRQRLLQEAKARKIKRAIQLRPPLQGAKDWAEYAELIAKPAR